MEEELRLADVRFHEEYLAIMSELNSGDGGTDGVNGTIRQGDEEEDEARDGSLRADDGQGEEEGEEGEDKEGKEEEGKEDEGVEVEEEEGKEGDGGNGKESEEEGGTVVASDVGEAL